MIIEDLPASRAAPACDELSRDLAILARSEPILYGDDRTARPFVNGLAKCPVPGDRGEKSLKSGPPACFGALMGGIRAGSGPGPVRSVPVVGNCLCRSRSCDTSLAERCRSRSR